MFWLALALASAAPPFDTIDPKTSPFPFQDHPPLEGTTEGVLVEIGDHPWGTPVGWTGAAHRNGPCAYLFFGSAGSSPRALYFATDDPEKGSNWMDDWTAGGTLTAPIDASMWCRSTDPDDDLTDAVHIVALEVNRGEGSPGGLHFVATETTALDGSEGVPMDPDAVLMALSERLDDAIAADAARTDAALQRGRARVTARADAFGPTVELPPSGGTSPGAPEITTHGPERRVHLAWDAAQDRLEVTMVDERVGLARVVWTVQPDASCPPGAPCRKMPPEVRQQAWTWGATRTARFVVDASGAVIEETIEPTELTGLAAL